MTGVEKEIIGQIELTQIEENTSYGVITFEKEAGVVQKNSKILPFMTTKYGATSSLPNL